MNFKDYYIITEAYGNYRLPADGNQAFGDFYIINQLKHELGIGRDEYVKGKKFQSDMVMRTVDGLWESIIFQLSNRMNGYLKAACLDELMHIFGMGGNLGWIIPPVKKDSNNARAYKRYFDERVKTFLHPDNLAQEFGWSDEVTARSRGYFLDGTDARDFLNYIGPYNFFKLVNTYKFVSGSGDLNSDESREFINDWHRGGKAAEKYWNYLGPNMISALFTAQDNTHVGDPPVNTDSSLDLRSHRRLSFIRWEEGYGGESWAAAVNVQVKLESLMKKLDYDKLVIYIDHIYDLEHNTGALLNKSSMVNVIKLMLDHRANAKNLEELTNLPHSANLDKLITARGYKIATDIDYRYPIVIDYEREDMVEN